MDQFDAYFRRADLDGDGRISGAEAVNFFQGSNLSKPVLAQVDDSDIECELEACPVVSNETSVEAAAYVKAL